METGNGNVDSNESHECFNSFIKHWAEARIDGPMQAIARYDDVAKLMTTIGGFLQAVLAAGYSLMVKELYASRAPIN